MLASPTGHDVQTRCPKRRLGMSAIALDSRTRKLAADLVHFLETGTPPERLFADDVFCDFTLPHWRLQAQGSEALVALRRRGHPAPGKVVRSRLDETPAG